MFSRPPRRTQAITGAAIVVLFGIALGASAVAVNAFGAGDKFDRLLAKIDRFVTGPPPDRGAATVLVTDPPEDDQPTDEPTARHRSRPRSPPWPPGRRRPPTPVPTPTPTPKPVRKRGRLSTSSRTRRRSSPRRSRTWCSPVGRPDDPRGPRAGRHLRRVPGQARRAGSTSGRAARTAATATGVPRRWRSRSRRTARPATRSAPTSRAARRLARCRAGDQGHALARSILLAWRGAHTWVMTGYRADADPRPLQGREGDGDATSSTRGTRGSRASGAAPTRRGRSRTRARCSATTSPWKRPEGRYPDRDGLFIAVVPTKPAP